MTASEHDDVLHLTDPRAIRAYTHRTRTALVGLLRTEGPLTATRAAELIGESVASCSYHLRMLAKYGVVEEVPGPGRQKPWRATAQFTHIPRALDAEAAAAATELRVFFAAQYFEEVAHAQRTADQLPPEWQEAESFGDELLFLTPAELAGLQAAIDELVQPFFARNTAPELRPAGAEVVQMLRIAYRRDRGSGGDGPGGRGLGGVGMAGGDSGGDGSVNDGGADSDGSVDDGGADSDGLVDKDGSDSDGSVDDGGAEVDGSVDDGGSDGDAA